VQLNTFLDYLNNSPESNLLIDGLLSNLFYGDQGLQIQITELFKFLIDVFHDRKTEILEIFYTRILPQMSQHFAKLEKNEYFYSFVQQYIEILTHCIRFHGYRIRQHITHNKLLLQIYQGFEINEKSVELAIIRLVKAIITSKDTVLIKHIIHNSLLDPIFEIYLKNAKKNNLLDSACLDLFESMRKENNENMNIHFLRRYKRKIEEYGLQKYFKKLLDRYEHLNVLSENEIQDENENFPDVERHIIAQ